MTHDPKKVPDPHPTCPRCHYFELKAAAEAAPARDTGSGFPRGIDQGRAQEILTRAFPQRQRSYG